MYIDVIVNVAISGLNDTIEQLHTLRSQFLDAEAKTDRLEILDSLIEEMKSMNQNSREIIDLLERLYGLELNLPEGFNNIK